MFMWRGNLRDAFGEFEAFETFEKFRCDAICEDQIVAIPHQCSLIRWGMDPKIEPRIGGKEAAEPIEEVLQLFASQW